MQSLLTGNISRDDCDGSLCTFCQMEAERKSFVLSGVCLESAVDAMFVMESPTNFLGYIHTSLIFSLDKERWEIVNTTNPSQVLAFMEEDPKEEFPIGVHQWQFLDTNCTDPGLQTRSLHLHLAVQQPGHFCCDDGLCVDSQAGLCVKLIWMKPARN